jgi:micrococcal nuclease
MLPEHEKSRCGFMAVISISEGSMEGAGMRKKNINNLKFLVVFLVLIGFADLFAHGIVQNQSTQNISLPERCKVIVVYDGDTIKVRFKDKQEWKVRLIGVDAPEIGGPVDEVEFQAQMSKRFTFYYLYQKKIKLSYEEELIDKYGRILAYVWTEEHGLFNKFIISEGFASAMRNFRYQYREEFREDEQEARKLEKGLMKRGEYTQISPQEASRFIGKLVTVKFMCKNALPKGKFVFLNSSQGEFSALISKENLSLYPDPQSFMGKDLSVTGFLEEYKGKPQIMILLPIQINQGGR